MSYEGNFINNWNMFVSVPELLCHAFSCILGHGCLLRVWELHPNTQCPDCLDKGESWGKLIVFTMKIMEIGGYSQNGRT